jgi:hypothetical protein
MLLKKLFLSLVILAALGAPAQAQVAVGISGGKFVTALDGSNLGSLNATNITAGLLGTARGGFGGSVASLTANYICGGPDGTSGPVVCRLMTAADIPSGIVSNAKLANSSITVAAGSGISVSGCGPVSLGGTCTITATGSVGPVITGQSLWTTPAVGEVGYLSANNTWAKAKADALYEGTASTLSLSGSQSCLLVAGLTLTAGDTLYLSDATAGRFTNVAPTTTGHYVYPLGVLVDTTSYNSGSGSAQPCIFRPSFIQGL